jgi:hypothetical protein
VVVGLGLPVFGLLLVADLTLMAPGPAIAHALVGVLLLLIALDARFLAEHPLPFLTAYVAGNRIKVAPLWFLAALVSAAIVSAIEATALPSVTGAVVLLSVLTAAWQALAWRWHRSGAPREDDLDLFQSQLDEATQLKL